MEARLFRAGIVVLKYFSRIFPAGIQANLCAGKRPHRQREKPEEEMEAGTGIEPVYAELQSAA